MVCFMKFHNTYFSSSNHQKRQKKTSFLSNKVTKALPLYRMIKLTAACRHPQRPILSHTQNPVVHMCEKDREVAQQTEWQRHVWPGSYLLALTSRRDMLLLMWFSSKLTKKLNNVSISLPECVEHWALKKLPACYKLITGEDDMWKCRRLGIVSLPCPR